MRTTIYGLALIMFVFLFSNCKKEVQLANNLEPEIVHNPVNTTSARFSVTLRVNSRGHLYFKDETIFFAFIKELMHDTKGEALLNLDSVGFTSLAAGKYSTTNTTSIIDGQQFDFLVGADSIIEIAHTLYKPVDGMNAILSMDSTAVNFTSYAKLSADILDNSVMNKFVVDNSTTDALDLFSFVVSTPSGYNPTLTAGAKNRPMFGSSTTPIDVVDPPFYDVYGNCMQSTHHYTQTTTYFFWIGSPHTPVYQGTTTVPGTGC